MTSLMTNLRFSPLSMEVNLAE